MKLKILLGIAGIVAIVAGIRCYMINCLKKDTKEEKKLRHTNDFENNNLSVDLLSEERSSKNELSLNETKTELSGRMSERHEEATKIMRESVEYIMSDETPMQTKNEKEKKQLFDELEKM